MVFFFCLKVKHIKKKLFKCIVYTLLTFLNKSVNLSLITRKIIFIPLNVKKCNSIYSCAQF